MASDTEEMVLKTIRETIIKQKLEAYFVGGFVRDELLFRKSKDIDLVIVGEGVEELLIEIAKKLGWEKPITVGRFGTAQIHGDRLMVEGVTARAESYTPDSRKPFVRPGTLEEDIWRRDFTINTLARDVSGKIIDLTGRGIADLKAGIIRTPLPPLETFSEDPLRMMRAARLAAELDMTVAPETIKGMRKVAKRMSIISAERTAEELRRILVSKHPDKGLKVLQEGGVLKEILPEFEAMVGVTQNEFHKYDVFEHTLAAVSAAHPATFLIRLATFMHDVGKVQTRSVGEDGKVHFYEHEKVGSKLAKKICERLRYPTKLTEQVTKLVALHMYPMLYESKMSDKAIRRLVSEVGDLQRELLSVSLADKKASAKPDTGLLQELFGRMRVVDKEGRIARKEQIISGKVVMAIRGVSGGPLVGKALKALQEARIEGQVVDFEGAKGWLSARKEEFTGKMERKL